MDPEDHVWITRRLLRRAALRAALLSIGFVASMDLLVRVPEGSYGPGPKLLLYAALVGLVGFPLTIIEAAVARRRDRSPLLHLAAAVVIGLAALVGSSLAWSQVRYTEAMLKRGSLEEGLAATRSDGPITRRPLVATTILVGPALGLALAAYLTLSNARLRERLVIAPLACVSILGGALFVGTSRPHALAHVHLVAFTGAVGLVAVLASVAGDAFDARLSRETT